MVKCFNIFFASNTNLSVINVSPVCEGKFTRVVTTKYGVSRTILDFFRVCDKILPHVNRMNIDGKHALTKFKKNVQ